MAQNETPRVDSSVTLHMASTQHNLAYDEWVAHCRCGWTGSYLPTQEDSRKEGDAHLAEANADKDPT